MFKDQPAALRSTFWKYALLSASLSAFGLVWGLAQGDTVILLLSAVIAALGTWRSLHLLKIIKGGKYRTLEGVVLSDTRLRLRSCHTLTLLLDDGSEVRELIAGSALLASGRQCRVYLHHPTQQDVLSALPEVLRPAQSMLGYELLDK